MRWIGESSALAVMADGARCGGMAVARRGRGCVRAIVDGWVANRSEVTRDLVGEGFGQAAASDADLVASAVAAWGEQAWGHLDGEFAAVVVAEDPPRVWAARDAFGLRPLFFRRGRAWLALASRAELLARLGPVSLDEGVIAEHLAGGRAQRSGTTLREVRRVPAGGRLDWERAGEGRVTLDRPLPPPSRVSLSAAEAASELRRRVGEAARARARPATALLLSGGLDSSTLFSVLREYGPPMATYSLSVPGPCDERAWSDAVVRHAGREAAHHVVEASDADFDYDGFAAAMLEPPPPPSAVVAVPLRRRAATDGVATLLSGLGADELFFGSEARYADLLRTGRVARLVREWLADRRHPGYVGAWSSAVMAVAPLVPSWARPALRRLTQATRVPRLVRTTFARRVDLNDRLRTPEVAGPFASCAQRENYRALVDGAFVAGLEAGQALSTACGVPESYPYLDRRVVEFALSLSDEQRCQNGVQKRVIQEAARGRLPDLVVETPPFFDFTFLLLPEMRRWVAAHPPDDWRSVEAGWVSLLHAVHECERICRRPDDELLERPARIWSLWAVVAAERFVRAFDGSAARAPG
ncbi:MAG: asparagine synthase-related protein [Acidobacteriota bacterium]